MSKAQVQKNVFVGVEQQQKDNSIISTRVYDARPYQKDAFYDFMDNNEINEKKYNYDDNMKFTIKKFNSNGLKQNYDRFCVLENEAKELHILSDDEDLLRGFVGWKNRLTN